MAVIRYLGTCSGTEPMAGMHHCSWMLETDGAIYWFDAGEGCAYTAYTAGVDIMKTRALFISHPHIDHVGGLSHLLFCFNKLIVREGSRLPNGNKLEAYISDHELFNAAKTVATSGSSGKLHYDISLNSIEDGVLYVDENVKITALHNRHLKGDGENGKWHSFSYLIETEGKRIIFSGDLTAPSELDPLLINGADILLMETGHHKVSDVCEYAADKKIGALRFHHHGREILEGRERAESFVSEFSAAHGFDIKLCYDGMTDIL
ncbi:MAG: MBL fold metallo-hydrolase [Clostridia bacterium]|nr:MBL fold metallo-hydrolase [Clostridia bacterium]